MGLKTGALLAAAVLALGACGPEETRAGYPPVQSTYTPAPKRAVVDAQTCEMFEAQANVNGRLAADGYADSYQEEWDALMSAAGC
jgi:hypothetical protein